MSYTMADYRRDKAKEYVESLSAEQRRQILARLPLEERLAGLSPQEISRYLKNLQAKRSPRKRKPRRKS